MAFCGRTQLRQRQQRHLGARHLQRLSMRRITTPAPSFLAQAARAAVRLTALPAPASSASPGPEDTAAWQSRALAMLPCLAHPDPRFATTAPSRPSPAWMRDKRLTRHAASHAQPARRRAARRQTPRACTSPSLIPAARRSWRRWTDCSLPEPRGTRQLVSEGATWLEQVRDATRPHRRPRLAPTSPGRPRPATRPQPALTAEQRQHAHGRQQPGPGRPPQLPLCGRPTPRPRRVSACLSPGHQR